MTPLVTIITPVFNQEKFIGKCLKSVKRQSFSNWEQIIIDDHSNDNTNSIISQYSKQDKRIRVIRHEKNWGGGELSSIYNEAFHLARGEYIAILEGDDWWVENHLEVLLESFDDKSIVLSYGDWVIVNEEGDASYLSTYHQDRSLLNNDPVGSILKLFSSLNFFILPATVMIRKKALKRIGGFCSDSAYPYIDFPTFLELALVGKFAYRRTILAYYRKHKNSLWFSFIKNTESVGREEMLQCMQNFYIRHKDVMSKNILSYIPSDESVIRKIQQKKDNKELSLTLHYILFKDKKKVHELLSNLLSSKSVGIQSKAIGFLLLSSLSFNFPLVLLLFRIKYLLYKCRLR